MNLIIHTQWDRHNNLSHFYFLKEGEFDEKSIKNI